MGNADLHNQDNNGRFEPETSGNDVGQKKGQFDVAASQPEPVANDKPDDHSVQDVENGGAQVGGDKITTGDINAGAVAIGRGAKASFIQVISQPALWQDTLFNFISANRYFLSVLVVVLAVHFWLYWRYKDLYLIEWWWYAISALLLLVASWTIYSSPFPRRIDKRAGTGIVTATGLLVIFSWQSWQIAFPPAFDHQVFGIALAEVTEGSSAKRTAATRELTDQVYERLCLDLERQYGQLQDVGPCVDSSSVPDQRRVAVKRIGAVPDSRTAERIGDRINADIVIWGSRLVSGPGGVTLRFEVLETLDKAINPDFRVIMPVTSSSAEILGMEYDVSSNPFEAKEVAAQQAVALSSYILGLIAYLDRDFPEAARQIGITLETIEENRALRVTGEGQALIYYYLARAYHALSRVEQGQKLLLLGEKANPDEPAILISLALGYGSLGSKEKLESYLNLALEKLNAWLTTNPMDSNALFDRGLAYEIDRQYVRAAFDYETLLEHDPGFYTAYIQLGLVTYELGRFDDAVEWFKKGIELAERSGTNPASAYTRLGEIYEKSGHMDLAKEAYKKAVELEPEVDGIVRYYAKFLESQQEIDAALLAYEQLADVSFNKGWAYSELASFYSRQGLFEAAILNYELAGSADKDDPLLYAQLAEAYFEQGRIEDALENYAEAVRLNEEAGIYYVYESYGRVLFELGRYQEAAEMFEKSIKQRPVNFPALMNLGQIYEVLGDSPKAAGAYCKVLDLVDEFSVEQTAAAKERLNRFDPEFRCPD